MEARADLAMELLGDSDEKKTSLFVEQWCEGPE